MKKIICAFISLALGFSAFADKIGLVLSGGGAKGAYEVGVWKAMQEFGLDLDVTLLSGASVGGLNAGLFACTNSDEAQKLWENEVGFSSFLMPDINNIKDIGSALLTAYNSGIGQKYAEPVDENSDSKIEQIKRDLQKAKGVATEELITIGKAITEYCLGDEHVNGLFNRDALRDILNRYISLEKLNNSGKEVYATTLRKEMLALKALSMYFVSDYSHNFKLNEQVSDQNARDIMLASSALPIAYESQFLNKDVVENGKIVGKAYEYIDGGFEAVGGKNTPIRPAVVSKNVDTIFVVYLANKEKLKEDARTGDGLVPEESVAGKRLIHFVPSQDLGNMFTGVINFSPEKIDRLIELGYEDAKKVLRQNGYRKPTASKLKKLRAAKEAELKKLNK